MNSVVQFLKRLAQILFFLVAVVFLGSLLIGVGGLIVALRYPAENVEKPAILALDLDGIIVDTRDIVESLRKYRKEDRIKGVLLRINSPGGVVGPSQELWAELKRTREEFKKPVVAFCSAVAASGAYYAAVGADKIVTTPVCLIGSIGALMEFVNVAMHLTQVQSMGGGDHWNRLPPRSSFAGTGLRSTACCMSRWNSRPRDPDVRRLKRKVYSSR